jgi:hypothetical protein
MHITRYIMIMKSLNISSDADCQGSYRKLFSNAIFILLLLITVLSSFNSINAQTTRMPTRQMASQNSSITTVGHQTYVHYGIRWLDVKQRFFGATLNISLADAIAAPGWKITFKFKNQDVGIMEYWGNWQSNMLAQSEYEAHSENLLPDKNGVYYFSFNGFFGENTASDGTLSGLDLSAAVIYPRNGRTIDSTALGNNFYVAPIAADLPTEAFGNFLRSQTDSLQRKFVTSNRNDATNLEANAKPTETKPASKTGLYVTMLLLGVFMIIVGTATVLRYRSREDYRKELANRKNETYNRPVDISQLPRIGGGNSIGGVYAPVMTARSTREQLLTIPTNPDRISRYSPMQSANLQSPKPLGHPERVDRQLRNIPETSVVQDVVAKSTLSSRHLIDEDTESQGYSDDLSTILPDDLREVTVEIDSNCMTVLPDSSNDTATSHRSLTAESYPPPPRLSELYDSYHIEDTSHRMVNER